jgi:cellulose 1,4-beta-cellobiosidase
VSLAWTSSAGAASYTVKRSAAAGGPYATVASGLTAASYTDTGLANGTTYHYVVSAVNTGGESPNSGEASATPQAPVGGFTLSVTPAKRFVPAGKTRIYTVAVTRSGSFSGSVALSVGGLAKGMTATFSPNPVAGASSKLTVKTRSVTPRGTFVLTVTGIAGSVTQTATATLVVTRPA